MSTMPDLPLAEHKKMDARADLADEFFAITSAEMSPFVSDEANWYDFDYVESDRLIEVVKSHYGVVLDETLLRMRFWRLLDYLNTHRGEQSEDYVDVPQT